jgi:hypothetical protein
MKIEISGIPQPLKVIVIIFLIMTAIVILYEFAFIIGRIASEIATIIGIK